MQACLPSFSLQQGVNLWKQPFGNADKPFAIVTEVGVSAKKMRRQSSVSLQISTLRFAERNSSALDLLCAEPLLIYKPQNITEIGRKKKNWLQLIIIRR